MSSKAFASRPKVGLQASAQRPRKRHAPTPGLISGRLLLRPAAKIEGSSSALRLTPDRRSGRARRANSFQDPDHLVSPL